MKRVELLIIFCLVQTAPLWVKAQGGAVGGVVVEAASQRPIEFATVVLLESGLWAVTDARGAFSIAHVPAGDATMEVRCLGYAKRVVRIRVPLDTSALRIAMPVADLRIDGVEVVARRRADEATTSYLIDRVALDNQQLLNLGNVVTLLPGGKTVNETLMSDGRLSLRSEGQEKGNASFGTAIEVDGQRVDNNAAMNETVGASLRNMSSADIESVEVVAGIPSVEHGDLSNGIVKVRTRRGKSPLIVEGKLNQHTRQVSIGKGLHLGHGGVLNVALERARSFSDVASPYTAYERNVVSLRYSGRVPFGGGGAVSAGLTGNWGGYNSVADPDETLESYTRVADNLLRGSVELRLLLNKPWGTNLQFKGSFSLQDKRAEYYSNASSASSQPYIHSVEEGYFIAQDYGAAPNASIVLGPTGYWYVRSWNDQKPQNVAISLKYSWNRHLGDVVSQLKAGAEYGASGNMGRGTHYEDMRYAPTWREFRYDALPWMRNYALWAEERLQLALAGGGSVVLTVGLRDDITHVKGSAFGLIQTLSPRVKGRWVLWDAPAGGGRRISLHAGWGKSVKLPSFQVLYPSPSYSDMLAFTPGSTWDNRAYYAYYTYVAQPAFNPNLRWQYTHQTDVGVEVSWGGVKVSLSGFLHKTFNHYMAVVQYSPYTYKLTGQAAIEGSGVAPANRRYTIDQATGVVTLHDASGAKSPMELSYTERLGYNSTRRYINGSPVVRDGLEWIADFAQIKAIGTSLRVDGSVYRYRGVDETLFPANTSGVGTVDNPAYPLVGYYRGSSSTSTSTVASATVANGREASGVNLNATFTTHVPQMRLVLALRLEASLYSYSRSLTESRGRSRGIVIDDVNGFFGPDYDRSVRNKYVAVYPEYYSTWSNPGQLIPFAERFAWARDNDPALYNQLSRLVVKTGYPYVLNPDYLSAYCSANFTVTKEVGDHVSVSFYANNFFNNMGYVRSSQTGLRSSIFGSGHIPRFYYGLSLRLKI
ncbi:MAG: TonB-dependent receptor [Bacteroidales bacterium]|nr:TonB-dependent receptor [Bacteroidales bacterium]